MNKLKTLFVILSFLFLTASSSKMGADGYVFVRKEFQFETMEITLVTHPSRAHLKYAYETSTVYTPYSSKKLAAFSVIKPVSKKCIIHVIDPSVEYQPEYLGHELAHCFYGRWHP